MTSYRKPATILELYTIKRAFLTYLPTLETNPAASVPNLQVKACSNKPKVSTSITSLFNPVLSSTKATSALEAPKIMSLSNKDSRQRLILSSCSTENSALHNSPSLPSRLVILAYWQALLKTISVSNFF